jgi:glycosyltransferase involved in cell wall biosynthesis
MSTIIVIPCYNEAKRLDGQKFVSYAETHSDTEFLFVNDGSRDATEQIIRALSERQQQLHCLNLTQNQGKAEAVRLGMLYAAENLSAEYVGFWDADLATPLEEIETFVEKIKRGDYDAVTGLRLVRLGADVKRRKLRHYLGRIFATAAAAILRVGVYDTQCGAKLFRADKVSCLFGDKFVSRWFFDIEIIARYIKNFGADAARGKIYEYPLAKWEDVKGSQLKLSDFMKAPMELLKIKRYYKIN